MKTKDLVTGLMELESQLEALPLEVGLSSRAKARLRAQVMAHAYQGRLADVGFWGRWSEMVFGAFAPRMLARPVGAALSVMAAVALAGSTTVSAAMESLPGDGLYPVKTAYEHSCLVLAMTEENRAQCYLWMASSRVVDIDRAADAGRLDAVEKSVESYGVSVGVALTLAANSKQPDKVEEHYAAVHTSLKEVYDKASQPVKDIVNRAVQLTTQPVAPSASVTTPNTETTTQPVPENHPVQPPGDSGFIDEVPAVAAAPAGSSWIADKGQPAGPAPLKDPPISSSPVGVPSSDVPLKNEPGPAPAPLPTKNDGAAVSEPEKADAPATASTPAASDSQVPSKDTPAPAPEQKPGIVVQGSAAIPLSGNK